MPRLPAPSERPPAAPETDPDYRVWISDLRAYFEGVWRVERAIEDIRADAKGEFDGEARFTPDGAGLTLEERGTLRYAGRYEGEGVRRYLWRFPRPAQARVLFADGTFFHRAVFRRGRAPVRHHCAEDAYEGVYLLEDANRWTLDWRVTGPRKDYFSRSTFFRAD